MEPLGYYKWHWQAWRANRRVQRMSWQARGLYRELLDEFWAEGSLPHDSEAMAEVCGCTLEEFAKFWDEIQPCFELRDGRLYNNKMDDQRTTKDQQRVALAKAGRAGGIAKLEAAIAEQKPSISQANASKSHIEEREERESTPPQKRGAFSTATEAELKGTGISVEAFNAHQAVRKLKKSPFASMESRNRWIVQWKMFYGEGKDTEAMMNEMITKNWVGEVGDKWKSRKMTIEEQYREAEPDEDFFSVGGGK